MARYPDTHPEAGDPAKQYTAAKLAQQIEAYAAKGLNNEALALMGSEIVEEVFQQVAREANLTLDKPDAISEHPFRVEWWNALLPLHVVVGRADDGIYFEVTRFADEWRDRYGDKF